MQAQPARPQSMVSAATEAQDRPGGFGTDADSPGGKKKSMLGKVKAKAMRLKDKIKSKTAGPEHASPEHEESVSDNDEDGDHSPPNQEVKRGTPEESKGVAGRDIRGDKLEGSPGADAPESGALQESLGRQNLGREDDSKKNLDERVADTPADEHLNEQIPAKPEEFDDEQRRNVSTPVQLTGDRGDQFVESALPPHHEGLSAPPKEDETTSIQTPESHQEDASKDMDESDPLRDVTAGALVDAPRDMTTEGAKVSGLQESLPKDSTIHDDSDPQKKVPAPDQVDAQRDVTPMEGGKPSPIEIGEGGEELAVSDNEGAFYSPSSDIGQKEVGYFTADADEGKDAEGNRIPPFESHQYEEAEGEKADKDLAFEGRDSVRVETDQYEDAEGEKAEDRAFEHRDSVGDTTVPGAVAGAAGALGYKASEQGEEKAPFGEGRPLDEGADRPFVERAFENSTTDKEGGTGVAASEMGDGGEEVDPNVVRDGKEVPAASGIEGGEQPPAADRGITNDEQLSQGEQPPTDERGITNDEQLSTGEGKPSISTSRAAGTAMGLRDTIASTFGYGTSSPSTESKEKGHAGIDEQPLQTDGEQQQLDPDQKEPAPTMTSRAVDTVFGFKDVLASKLGYGASKSPTSPSEQEAEARKRDIESPDHENFKNEQPRDVSTPVQSTGDQRESGLPAQDDVPAEPKDEQTRDVSTGIQSTDDQFVESAVPAHDEGPFAHPKEEDKNASVLTSESNQSAIPEEEKELAQHVSGGKFEGPPGADAPKSGTVQDSLGRLNLGPQDDSGENLEERNAGAPADEKLHEEILAKPEELKDEQRDVGLTSVQSTGDGGDQCVESVLPAHEDGLSAPPKEEDATHSVLTRESDQGGASKDVIMQDENEPSWKASAGDLIDDPRQQATTKGEKATNLQEGASKDTTMEDESEPPREVFAADLSHVPRSVSTEGATSPSPNRDAESGERGDELPAYGHEGGFDSRQKELGDFTAVEGDRTQPVETDQYKDAEAEKTHKDRAFEGDTTVRDTIAATGAASAAGALGYEANEQGADKSVHEPEDKSLDVDEEHVESEDKPLNEGEAKPLNEPELDRERGMGVAESEIGYGRKETDHEVRKLEDEDEPSTERAFKDLTTERGRGTGIAGLETGNVGKDVDSELRDGKNVPAASGNAEEGQLPADERGITKDEQLSTGESEPSISTRAEASEGEEKPVYEGEDKPFMKEVEGTPLNVGEDKPSIERAFEVLTTDKEGGTGVAGSEMGYGGQEVDPEVRDGKKVPFASVNEEEGLLPSHERDIAKEEQLSKGESKPSFASVNEEEGLLPSHERDIAKEEQLSEGESKSSIMSEELPVSDRQGDFYSPSSDIRHKEIGDLTAEVGKEGQFDAIPSSEPVVTDQYEDAKDEKAVKDQASEGDNTAIGNAGGGAVTAPSGALGYKASDEAEEKPLHEGEDKSSKEEEGKPFNEVEGKPLMERTFEDVTTDKERSTGSEIGNSGKKIGPEVHDTEEQLPADERDPEIRDRKEAPDAFESAGEAFPVADARDRKEIPVSPGKAGGEQNERNPEVGDRKEIGIGSGNGTAEEEQLLANERDPELHDRKEIPGGVGHAAAEEGFPTDYRQAEEGERKEIPIAPGHAEEGQTHDYLSTQEKPTAPAGTGTGFKDTIASKFGFGPSSSPSTEPKERHEQQQLHTDDGEQHQHPFPDQKQQASPTIASRVFDFASKFGYGPSKSPTSPSVAEEDPQKREMEHGEQNPTNDMHPAALDL